MPSVRPITIRRQNDAPRTRDGLGARPGRLGYFPRDDQAFDAMRIGRPLILWRNSPSFDFGWYFLVVKPQPVHRLLLVEREPREHEVLLVHKSGEAVAGSLPYEAADLGIRQDVIHKLSQRGQGRGPGCFPHIS